MAAEPCFRLAGGAAQRRRLRLPRGTCRRGCGAVRRTSRRPCRAGAGSALEPEARREGGTSQMCGSSARKGREAAARQGWCGLSRHLSRRIWHHAGGGDSTGLVRPARGLGNRAAAAAAPSVSRSAIAPRPAGAAGRLGRLQHTPSAGRLGRSGDERGHGEALRRAWVRAAGFELCLSIASRVLFEYRFSCPYV